eukprot:m.175375 g.175375  ORF g.175375 m.175375 type:complete len:50 (-) comp18350_c0_seq17:321-470(-)
MATEIRTPKTVTVDTPFPQLFSTRFAENICNFEDDELQHRAGQREGNPE